MKVVVVLKEMDVYDKPQPTELVASPAEDDRVGRILKRRAERNKKAPYLARGEEDNDDELPPRTPARRKYSLDAGASASRYAAKTPARADEMWKRLTETRTRVGTPGLALRSKRVGVEDWHDLHPVVDELLESKGGGLMFKTDDGGVDVELFVRDCGASVGFVLCWRRTDSLVDETLSVDELECVDTLDDGHYFALTLKSRSAKLLDLRTTSKEKRDFAVRALTVLMNA